MSAVVLYGPPTAGKDTITSLLTEADDTYRLVTKLKHGTGRTAGYRFVSAQELDDLRDQGRIIVETHRYGNVYAVDKQDLDDMRAQGLVPVVHIGNAADLRRLLTGVTAAWTRVLLWVPREICGERSRLRGDQDTAARLDAWDATAEDLLTSDLHDLFDLVIRTDQVSSVRAAETITKAAWAPRTACEPSRLRETLQLADVGK